MVGRDLGYAAVEELVPRAGSNRAVLTAVPFDVDWRHRSARANGQLAVGCYAWDERAGPYVAYALDVLTVRGAHIAAIVSFLDASRFRHTGCRHCG